MVNCWQRPPPGWLKCNIDASISLNSITIGVGMVVCDDAGMFMLGFSKTVVGSLIGVGIGLVWAIKSLKRTDGSLPSSCFSNANRSASSREKTKRKLRVALLSRIRPSAKFFLTNRLWAEAFWKIINGKNVVISEATYCQMLYPKPLSIPPVHYQKGFS